METVQKILELSPDTLKALEKLAKITGANSTGELIQDALRLYEWIIYEQVNGRQVAAIRLPRDAAPQWSQWSTRTGSLEPLDDVEVIAPLFEKDAEEEAKRYFKAA